MVSDLTAIGVKTDRWHRGKFKNPNLNCKDKLPSTSLCSQWRERWAVINQKYTDGLLIPPCSLYSNWRGSLQSPASPTWGQSLSPREQLRKMCTWHRERTLRVLLTARLCSDSWSTVWTAIHTQNKKRIKQFSTFITTNPWEKLIAVIKHCIL